VLEIVATLQTSHPTVASTRTVKVTLALAPGGTVPTNQDALVAGLPLVVHPPVQETNSVPAGIGSLMTTPVAAPSPVFE
jgi:hypothetical protein